MDGPTFHQTRRRVLDLYHAARYEDALAEVEREWHRFPERAPVRYFFEMCLLCRTGDVDAAMARFDEALAGGIWWAESQLDDPDLDPARAAPGWDGRVAECRRLQAATGPPPEPIVVEPTGMTLAGTVLVLHGQGATPPEHVREWDCAVARGWRLVAPYGSVPHAYRRWAWDRDGAVERLASLLPRLAGDGPLLVAGFSLGAGLAARLACEGVVAAGGAVLVGPVFGAFGSPWPAVAPLPTYAVIGEHDYARAEAVEILDHLGRAGWPVEVEIAAGHYHEYPDDFAPSFVRALRFLGLG